MTFGLLFQLRLVCFLLGKIRVTGFFVMFFSPGLSVCFVVGWMNFERVWICGIASHSVFPASTSRGNRLYSTIPGFFLREKCLCEASLYSMRASLKKALFKKSPLK